jgi:hypothetical protein
MGARSPGFRVRKITGNGVIETEEELKRITLRYSEMESSDGVGSDVVQLVFLLVCELKVTILPMMIKASRRILSLGQQRRMVAI